MIESILVRGGCHIHVAPRHTWPSFDAFREATPNGSIALDGIVLGGPAYADDTRHVNFDHHDGVVREATMSTAMQVYFAIKGGLMSQRMSPPFVRDVYVNDTDQDTALAVWLLCHSHQFHGTASIPHMNRLLALNDRLDITGGAFPMDIYDGLLAQHNWIFEPYTSLRKSGALAMAAAGVMRDNLECVLGRLDAFMMGEGGILVPDNRYEILSAADHRFEVVDEIGGTDARQHLFSGGMNAFVALVARRSDGRFVYTIGRRSRYIDFPLSAIYAALNAREECDQGDCWGGSDIIGGSPREAGSKLTWEEVRDIVTLTLDSHA